MRPATHDSDVIVMNDGIRVGIHSTRSGFLPEKMLDALEGYVAEALHVYLQESKYNWPRCQSETNKSLLTEMFENHVDVLKDEYSDKIRFVHVTTRLPMTWVIEIRLEDASASCIVKIEMHERKQQ